jgi:site-specific DNA-methyltransferase (adenine-specific)
MSYTIIQGDNRDTLKTLADNSIDAIVTDPPYGIDFLGKSWDANVGALETYAECLRVLKPGGHILAFSAARTYHHLAVTLEQAGFEIRDQIMWIYSSGFPKSQDIGRSIERSEQKVKNKATKNKLANNDKVYFPDPENVPVESAGQLTAPRCSLCHSSTGPIHKKCSREDCIRPWEKTPANNEWAGWGTQLKPAHEPIALARKPMKTSIAKNCQKWGTGALNIDATRVPYEDEADLKLVVDWAKKYTSPGVQEYAKLDGSVERTRTEEQFKSEASTQGRFPSNVLGDIPDYQKYFYCPKVSRRERHIGFPKAKGMFEIAREHGYTLEYPEGNYDNPAAGYMVDKQGNKVPDLVLQKLVEQHGGGNNHPTVKPIELMKYLIKLVTPPGGTVLDPFNGSGSTGCAAVELGFNYIGCELDPAYVEIANKRIAAWLKQSDPLAASGLFDVA